MLPEPYHPVAPDVILTYGAAQAPHANGVPVIKVDDSGGPLRFSEPLPPSTWTARLIVPASLDDGIAEGLAQRLRSMGMKTIEIVTERSQG